MKASHELPPRCPKTLNRPHMYQPLFRASDQTNDEASRIIFVHRRISSARVNQSRSRGTRSHVEVSQALL